MARISLLFSLAFVLSLGSLFLSVSGHDPLVPPRKPSCPKTVSELQTLPFTEITEILNRKEQFAPKTAEFKAMFTMCKGYVAYLESLYKFENPIVDVLGIAKARYGLMTKAILDAQASVSGKVNKKISLKLKKSSADLTKGFLQIKETIVKISAKHQFKADAKITAHESKKLNHAMIKFKNSVNAFMNVVYNLEKKKIGHRARALEEDQDDDRVRNAWDRFFRKFGGYLGGKTHGRELYTVEAPVGAQAGGTFSQYFDSFFGNKAHGRELYTVKAPAGAQAGETFSPYFDSFSADKAHRREMYTIEAPAKAKTGGTFSKYFDSFSGDKAHGRELYTIEAPVGAQAGGTFSKYFDSFFGNKAHGRELYTVKAPAGAQASGTFSKYFDSFSTDKAHGREMYTVEAPAGAQAGGTFSKYFDSFFGNKAHGRELYIVGPDGVNAEAPVGDNAAAPTSETAKDLSQSRFDKFFRYFYGDKAHGRELYTVAPAGDNAGGKVKGSFGDFLNVGFGGKVQFDAAGKMKVAGEDGFKSLNRAHYKPFASTEA